MLPILYSFRRCPYAIRARIALRKAGVAVELREVQLRNKPREMTELSPKATVPVLAPGDGSVIDESLAIMRWALQHNDPANWLADADTPTSRALIECNDGAFKQALDRYKYAERFPQEPPAAHRAVAEAALIEHTESLLQQQPFLAGMQPGFADVAVFPFIRQFAAVDTGWFEQSAWQGTRRWLNGWQQSADFLDVMDKFEPWAPGQVPVVFGPARR
ncbi:glutathione S-transferase [Piscinibacter sakaiensis]|uniref:glutathione S-transferase n=1 Tax=Piscinibacter sakaiensis TaxID=1547922 RepID=UPI003AAB07CD